MIRKFFIGYAERFVSRWVVFIKDLLLVGFSILSAYLLRFNFLLPEHIHEVLFSHLLLVTGLSAVAFIITKSYAGIIRHTSLQDVLNITKSIILVSGALVVLNLADHFFHLHWFHVLPYSVLLIFTALSLVFLIFTRLAIRLFYFHVISKGGAAGKVIIYGAGKAGLITKNALLSGIARHTIVGFIDDNPGKVGKSLEGIPVYSPEILKTDFIARKKVDEIIFAIHNIGPLKRNLIVEDLIKRFKIRVKEIPPVEKWINGELTIKQISNIQIEDLLQREAITLGNEHVLADTRGKVVMVTGAAGSIGSELARQLCHLAVRKLVFVDQAETPLYELEQQVKALVPNVFDACDFVIADVSCQETIDRLFGFYTPDIIYHAAAYKHVPMMEVNPFEAVRVNIFGTKLVADAALAYKAQKFVMVSTDKAVNPTNIMGASKRVAEIYIQSLNLASGNKTRFITTRFGNVLGSNGSVIPLFTKQIASGGPVTVTHPDITRYFMTIPEACRLVFEAGAMGKGGEIFVFDMGQPVKIVDLARKMIRLSGFEPDKDIMIKYVGLRPGEKIFEELLNNEEHCMPTHHPKITIAKVRYHSYADVLEMFADLRQCIGTGDRMVVVSALKRIVPEFISKNSVYEDLDSVMQIDRKTG